LILIENFKKLNSYNIICWKIIFFDYYLERQKIFGFKYLPGDKVAIRKNGRIRPAEIDVPTSFAYNGVTEAEILDGSIPVQSTLPI